MRAEAGADKEVPTNVVEFNSAWAEGLRLRGWGVQLWVSMEDSAQLVPLGCKSEATTVCIQSRKPNLAENKGDLGQGINLAIDSPGPSRSEPQWIPG